jgi:GT2 family glycosyltransferase
MDHEKSPLLSVIIPVYNAEEYVEDCIRSVFNQGIENIEIICVDDGSSDNSVAVLQKLAAQEPRIRVVCQENRSAGAARNHGMKYARGTYVHFLDADDRVCDGIYQKAIEKLESTGANACVFQYVFYDNSTGEEIPCPCLLNGRERITTFRQEPAFFMYNMVAPWNKLYRRAWMKQHDMWFDEIHCGNDRGFYYRSLAAGGTMVLCMDHGVAYRVKNAKALTGTNRYRHLDSLFFAWDTSITALEGESKAVQAMLLDCAVKDLLFVFDQAPREKRGELVAQLGGRFGQVDFSVIETLPFPYAWGKAVEQIRQGNDPGRKRSVGDRIKKLIAMKQIWGIRGCIVKLLAR